MLKVSLIFVLLTLTLNAQRYWWIGGNLVIPASRYGFDIGYISEHEIGWFGSVNSNFNARPDANYYENIDYNEAKYVYRDKEIKKISNDVCVYLGITYPIVDYLFVCPSAFYFQKETFRGFKDEFHILGTNGIYYVKSTTDSNIGLNLSLLYWKAESGFTSKLGFEYVNESFNTSIGIGFVLGFLTNR